jgi:hypothetical protein
MNNRPVEAAVLRCQSHSIIASLRFYHKRAVYEVILLSQELPEGLDGRGLITNSGRDSSVPPHSETIVIWASSLVGKAAEAKMKAHIRFVLRSRNREYMPPVPLYVFMT